MERALGHLLRVDQLATQAANLHRAEQIRGLVQRPVAALERAQYFGACRRAFVTSALDEEVDRLLRRPLTEVKLERENNPRAPVHSPKERTNAVLGCRIKP